MLGLPAWGVRRGYGSFLTFDFGKPELTVAERQSKERGLRRDTYVYGQWHLWIYCCHWRVLEAGTQIAWSEDSKELMGRAAANLNGQKLLAVAVDPTCGRSTFSFDLGGSLETWPYGDDPTEEQWMIYALRQVFTYRADGFYSCDPSDTLPDQTLWLPLA